MNTFVDIAKAMLEVVICTGLIPVFVYIVRFLKTKVVLESHKKLLEDVEIAVTSAEQLYDSGEGKKSYVEQLLIIMGYDLNDEINAVIESTVNRFFPFHYEDEELYEEDDEE